MMGLVHLPRIRDTSPNTSPIQQPEMLKHDRDAHDLLHCCEKSIVVRIRPGRLSRGLATIISFIWQLRRAKMKNENAWTKQINFIAPATIEKLTLLLFDTALPLSSSGTTLSKDPPLPYRVDLGEFLL
jgi:hypothetical protein